MAFRFIVSLLVVLAPAAVSAAEDPVAEAQKIISDQIAALMAGNGAVAYALASPGIRGTFPSEDKFLEMVRKQYEPLSHPAHYAFGRSKTVGGGELVLQEVIVNRHDAKDWSAIYEMRLQDDGSYKVNGVRVLAKTSSTGI